MQTTKRQITNIRSIINVLKKPFVCWELLRLSEIVCYEFNNFFLNYARQVFPQNGYFENRNGLEIAMHYYIVFVLSPDVKFVYINSFAQFGLFVPCRIQKGIAGRLRHTWNS